MGLPLPLKGSGTFHLTFSSGPQLSGAAFSEERPVPSGPRQQGQSSAVEGRARSRRAATPRVRVQRVRMAVSTTDMLHTTRQAGGTIQGPANVRPDPRATSEFAHDGTTTGDVGVWRTPTRTPRSSLSGGSDEPDPDGL